MNTITTISRVLLVGILAVAFGIFSGCDAGSSMEESNDPPEAEVTIASTQPYPAGEAILLDGTSSSDPDGDSLSYSWSLSTPSGSNTSLSDDDASQTTFTPDTKGDYTATLQVSDGEEQSTDDATVSVEPGTNPQISSNIRSDRTLKASTDYVVTSDVCIENSSTLTINPGVLIEFEADASLQVCGDGSALVADGTTDSTITMTGTQADANGWWKGIGLYSSNPNNLLNYVEIEHAASTDFGSMGAAGAVALNNGSELTLKNSTIKDGGAYGLHVDEANIALAFSGNSFSGHNKAPVNVPFNLIGKIDDGSTFASGTFVRVWSANPSSGSITVDALSNDVPYRIADQVGLDDTVTMTISAGVEMTFASHANITVNSDDAALIGDGSSSDKITMTATPGNEEKGWWEGIGLYSSNQNNALRHVTIKHAGSQEMSAVGEAGAVVLNKGSELTLKNSTIAESGDYGVHVDEGNINLAFAENTFSGNETAPMNIPFTNIGVVDNNSSFPSGTYVRVWGSNPNDGSITVDALSNDVPYRIADQMGLDGTVSMTINPGVEMTFTSNSNITVNSNDAYLEADGGSSSGIITMSATPGNKNAGFWEGIGFYSSNSNNRLEYVRIRHGASQEMSAVGARGNVVLNNDAELTLKNSEIEDSDQHGVHCDEASTTLTSSGNSFSNIAGSNYNGC